MRDSRTADDILELLAAVADMQGKGFELEAAIATSGVSEFTYYRYLARYGALAAEQITRLRRLESENARLRRKVTALMLDRLDLQDSLACNKR